MIGLMMTMTGRKQLTSNYKNGLSLFIINKILKFLWKKI